MDINHQIFIASDEEVTSILERVKNHPEKEIAIIAPPQAKLFQSAIHLKLLYKEGLALEKIITIVSSNEVGLTLAANNGFPTEFKKEVERKVTKTRTKRTTTKNKTVQEKIDGATFMLPSPGKRVIGLFFAASALVFVIIAYFVLPTVTIRVTPEAKIEKPLERITLADSTRNGAEIALNTNTMVPTFIVETEVELTKTYATTGVTSTGQDATGQMTIHNDGDLVQLLIARTRFQSPDGYIFRIPAAISVPGKGTITTTVVADPVDNKGQVVGSKGNLPANTRFTLPALKGSYKDLIYGINEQAFTGGTTQAIRTVADQDLTSASKDIVDQISTIAITKLRERLDQESTTTNRSLTLIDNPKVIKITVETNTINGGVKAKDVRESFEAYAKIKISTVAFDRKDVVKILDRKLSSILHPDMSIASIDTNNLEVQFVELDTRTQKIKVNVTMPYRLEYQFKADFITRLKSQIAGMSLADTNKYLNGLESIADSQISSWPFWVSHIPAIKSNINFVIPKDNIK